MKDLVCDVEKVTEIVGVPPEQVVDVMALRETPQTMCPEPRESARRGL